MAAPPAVAAVGMLEAEFRALAQEARSKEGLAGFFSSTADQQAVKDAAERVILKVRSCGEAPDAMDQIKTQYQVGQAARFWRSEVCMQAIVWLDNDRGQASNMWLKLV